ncbi:hypothetical protein FQZ97_918820 [compost metagenome]
MKLINGPKIACAGNCECFAYPLLIDRLKLGDVGGCGIAARNTQRNIDANNNPPCSFQSPCIIACVRNFLDVMAETFQQFRCFANAFDHFRCDRAAVRRVKDHRHFQARQRLIQR